MGPNDIRYSLLVATKNRAEKLSQFVSVLRQFTARRDWELVIVDNGSTDDSAARLELLAESLDVPVKILFESAGGKSRALNKGLSATTGTIVVFTDDDCYLEAGFFEALDRVFVRPEIGYCGGRILLHDPSDARMTIRESVEHVYLPPRSFVEPGLIQGANMALRGEVLRHLGGFDADLGPGTPYIAEDVDVVARASWEGWAGGYFPEPTVRHHHGRKPGPDLERMVRSYQRGLGAYFAKFILRRDSRGTFARNWYWRLRSRPYRALQVSGAIGYLWRRGAGRLFR